MTRRLEAGVEAIQYVDASPASRDRSIENPRLRSPVSAARVVCGSQPVALMRASSVAPPFALSISATSACFDPARGEVTFSGGGVEAELFEPSPLLCDGERGAVFLSERGACFASSSSSTPMASRPARVIIRLIERPSSSSRQTGIPGFCRVRHSSANCAQPRVNSTGLLLRTER